MSSNYYGTIGATDEWFTPKYIFDALGVEFDMDVSSPLGGPRHTPLSTALDKNFLTIEDDGLVHPWSKFIWMNPPFGGRNGLVPWMDRFFEYGNGVALAPDRTSAPWWQDAAARSDAMLLMRGKTKFERPDGTLGKSPADGVTLFASGPDGVRALKNADGVLGLTFSRLAI